MAGGVNSAAASAAAGAAGKQRPERAGCFGEEEIREDNENGKGETHRRLQPALLLAGGWRRSCGRLVGRRLRASVEVGSDVRLCVTVWPVRG